MRLVGPQNKPVRGDCCPHRGSNTDASAIMPQASRYIDCVNTAPKFNAYMKITSWSDISCHKEWHMSLLLLNVVMEIGRRESEGKLKAIKRHIACYISILDIPGASNSKWLHRETKEHRKANQKIKHVGVSDPRGRVYIKAPSHIIAVLPHTHKLRIQSQTTRPSESYYNIKMWPSDKKKCPLSTQIRNEKKGGSEVGDWLKINSGKTGNTVNKVLRGSIMDSHCWGQLTWGQHPRAGACLLKYCKMHSIV